MPVLGDVEAPVTIQGSHGDTVPMAMNHDPSTWLFWMVDMAAIAMITGGSWGSPLVGMVENSVLPGRFTEFIIWFHGKTGGWGLCWCINMDNDGKTDG